MAVVLFQADETENLFLDEYLENNPSAHGKEFEILSIRANKKGSGWIIETKAFITFRFKNDSVMKQLMEAFDVWLERGNGQKLILQVDKNAKGLHHIGADFEFTRIWRYDERKKCYQQTDSVSGFTKDGSVQNPFLQCSSPPMSTPQEEPPPVVTTRRAKRGS